MFKEKSIKYLNGSELAGYIKARQAKAVRGLRQAWHINPKLAIIVTKDDPVIDKYISLKQKYAQDIEAEVEVYRVEQSAVPELLDQTKKDKTIHGVIIQLPLTKPEETESLCSLIPLGKDIDGLNSASTFVSATATAIMWLLNGYDIDLLGKKVVVIGQGKLVGEPVTKLLNSSDVKPVTIDENNPNLTELKDADIIISGAGHPGLISSDLIKSGAVLVDAGTTNDNGQLKGDVADDVYNRTDITITPKIGGVGPLTIAVLFENLITSARGTKGNLPTES